MQYTKSCIGKFFVSIFLVLGALCVFLNMACDDNATTEDNKCYYFSYIGLGFLSIAIAMFTCFPIEFDFNKNEYEPI